MVRKMVNACPRCLVVGGVTLMLLGSLGFATASAADASSNLAQAPARAPVPSQRGSSPAVPPTTRAETPAPGGAPPTDGAPPTGGLSLTLEDALARAETASGLVRMARAEKNAVMAQDVGASLLLPANPVVAASVGPRTTAAPGGGRQRDLDYALHVEQTLEVANQRGVRRAEVARAVDVAGWRENLARAETRARVRAVYFGVLLAKAQVRAARSREELVQQLVNGVRTRVDTGAASNVELEMARLEHGRALRERLSAELAVGQALAELRVLLALPPASPIELTSQLARPGAPLALSGLLARAAERRTELRVLMASQAMLDAAVVRLRREAVPNPTLFLDLQRERPGELYLAGGIALPIPVWRRNQGELALARAERSRLQEEEDIVGRQIAAEVERAYGAAVSFAQVVGVVESEILPAAEASVDLVTQGWRAGKFDLFRVIQASREVSDARRGQLESLGALWDASIALDRATGTP